MQKIPLPELKTHLKNGYCLEACHNHPKELNAHGTASIWVFQVGYMKISCIEKRECRTKITEELGFGHGIGLGFSLR